MVFIDLLRGVFVEGSSRCQVWFGFLRSIWGGGHLCGFGIGGYLKLFFVKLLHSLLSN